MPFMYIEQGLPTWGSVDIHPVVAIRTKKRDMFCNINHLDKSEKVCYNISVRW
jgi:hypothetical protein